MALNIFTGFDIHSTDPIDDRLVVNNRLTDTKLDGTAYQGLIVFDSMDNKLYVLTGTDRSQSSSWTEIGAGSGDTNVPNLPALDANSKYIIETDGSSSASWVKDDGSLDVESVFQWNNIFVDEGELLDSTQWEVVANATTGGQFEYDPDNNGFPSVELHYSTAASNPQGRDTDFVKNNGPVSEGARLAIVREQSDSTVSVGYYPILSWDDEANVANQRILTIDLGPYHPSITHPGDTALTEDDILEFLETPVSGDHFHFFVALAGADSGTEVEANPSGTDGTTMTRIRVDGTNYNLPSGGSGNVPNLPGTPANNSTYVIETDGSGNTSWSANGVRNNIANTFTGTQTFADDVVFGENSNASTITIGQGNSGDSFSVNASIQPVFGNSISVGGSNKSLFEGGLTSNADVTIAGGGDLDIIENGQIKMTGSQLNHDFIELTATSGNNSHRAMVFQSSTEEYGHLEVDFLGTGNGRSGDFAVHLANGNGAVEKVFELNPGGQNDEPHVYMKYDTTIDTGDLVVTRNSSTNNALIQLKKTNAASTDDISGLEFTHRNANNTEDLNYGELYVATHSHGSEPGGELGEMHIGVAANGLAPTGTSLSSSAPQPAIEIYGQTSTDSNIAGYTNTVFTSLNVEWENIQDLPAGSTVKNLVIDSSNNRMYATTENGVVVPATENILVENASGEITTGNFNHQATQAGSYYCGIAIGNVNANNDSDQLYKYLPNPNANPLDLDYATVLNAVTSSSRHFGDRDVDGTNATGVATLAVAGKHNASSTIIGPWFDIFRSAGNTPSDNDALDSMGGGVRWIIGGNDQTSDAPSYRDGYFDAIVSTQTVQGFNLQVPTTDNATNIFGVWRNSISVRGLKPGSGGDDLAVAHEIVGDLINEADGKYNASGERGITHTFYASVGSDGTPYSRLVVNRAGLFVDGDQNQPGDDGTNLLSMPFCAANDTPIGAVCKGNTHSPPGASGTYRLLVVKTA